MFFSCFSGSDFDVTQLKSAAVTGEDSKPWSNSFIRFSSVDETNVNFSSKRASVLRRASFTESSAYQVGWVLNSETDRCLCCQNKFSLLRRRHHCRMCGDIVCNDCSQFRAIVDGLGPFLQRICIECHEIQVQKAIREQIYEQKSGRSYYSEQIFPNLENREKENSSTSTDLPQEASTKREKTNTVNDSQNFLVPTSSGKENLVENKNVSEIQTIKDVPAQVNTNPPVLKPSLLQIEPETKQSIVEESEAKNQINTKTPIPFNQQVQPKNEEKVLVPKTSIQSQARENFLFKSVGNFENGEPTTLSNNFDESDDDEVYAELPMLDQSQLPTEEMILQQFPTIAQTTESDNLDEIVENVMEIVLEVISDITAVELFAMAEIELEEEVEKKKRNHKELNQFSFQNMMKDGMKSQQKWE